MRIFATALLAAVPVLLAQSSPPSAPVTNPLDGLTPQAMRGAEPSSTYVLSGFDSINYYSGSMHFALPVVKVGGRGDATHNVVVAVKPPNWTVDVGEGGTNTVNSSLGVHKRTFTATATYDSQGWWHQLDPGYGPGFVLGRKTVDSPKGCGSGLSPVYSGSFTYLVFVQPGGQEVELYDTAYTSNGVLTVDSATCTYSQSGDRGLVFNDHSGQGLTFVHDDTPGVVDVGDLVGATTPTDASQPVMTISGWLYYRNGSRARVEGSRIMKIYDRHGNQTSFCYDPCSQTPGDPTGPGTSGNLYAIGEIVDPLKRKIVFNYDTGETAYGPKVDQIVYRPNGTTATQIIRVAYGYSNDTTTNIGGTTTLIGGTTAALFPDLGFNGTSAARMVPVAIYLPNATTQQPSYRFHYNKFGELAQVTLPTGGRVHYTYGAGAECGGAQYCFDSGQILQNPAGAYLEFTWYSSGDTSPSRPLWSPIIYRRLLERREYTDGSNESKLTTIGKFERVESVTQVQHPGPSGTPVQKYSAALIKGRHFVEVRESGLDVAKTSVTRHYFDGVARPWEPLPATQVPTLIENPPADYVSVPGLWHASIGPAAELLAKGIAPSRVTGYPNTFVGKEYRTEAGELNGSNVAVLRRDDSVFKLSGRSSELCQTVATLVNGANTVSSGSLQYFDGRQNVTDSYEYDYGAAPAIDASQAAPTSGFYLRTCPDIAPANWLRRGVSTYQSSSSYLDPPAHLLSLVLQQQVFGPGSGSPLAQVAYTHDGSTPSGSAPTQWVDPQRTQLGNVTTVARLAKDLYTNDGFGVTETTLTETRTYDKAGNVLSITDPRLNTTHYSYEDSCAGAQSASFLAAFPKQATFAPANAGDAAHTMQWTYDCFTGKPTSFTERNGAVTSFAYETAENKLNRLTQVTKPNGAKTVFAYIDTPLAMSVTATSDQYAANDGKRQTKTEYDGFGRAKRVIAGSGASAIYADTSYDGFGRVLRSYQLGVGGPSSSYDTFEYDGLGRVTTVQRPGGAADVTQYILNETTQTDAASASVRRTADALGRITKAVEDPAGLNYVTDYTYDALGNLGTVAQKGTGGAVATNPLRSFGYDSLGRLRKADNPESGIIRFRYDGNGNVIERRAADGTITTSTWDNLNRLARKTFSGTGATWTKTATWCYDGRTWDKTSGNCTGSIVTAAKGKLTASGSDESWTQLNYDSFGRLASSTQRTPASWEAPPPAGPTPYTFTYVYNADDSVSTVQTPRRNLQYCYDEHGRPTWVSGSKNAADCAASPTGGDTANLYYASQASYAPHGGITSLRLGNGLTETTSYNTRLQMATRQVAGSPGTPWSISYDYGAANVNNGNPLSYTQSYNGGGAVATTFSYDKANRLKETLRSPVGGSTACGAGAAIWCQGYGYDERGNLLVTAEQGLGSSPQRPSAYTAGNRISTAGYDYDGRGNLKQAPTLAGNYEKMVYDGEERQAAYCYGIAAGTACDGTYANKTVYHYDAEGRRVRREGVGGEAVFVYDGMGDLALEVAANSTGAGTSYLTADQLGTTRVVTGQDGAAKECFDYLPFGQELNWPCGQSAVTRVRFTGKERDAETGLDYFGARYLSAAQGRFTSPDAPFADQHAEDPQSWNLYGYVRNNPLAAVDADGEKCQSLSGGPCRFKETSSADPRLLVASTALMSGGLVGAGSGAGYAASTAWSFARNLVYSAYLGLATPFGRRMTEMGIEAVAPPGMPTFSAASAAESFGLKGAQQWGDLFHGTLANGAEVAAGFAKRGDNLAVNIFAAYNPEGMKGKLGTIKAIYEGAMTAGRTAAARTVTLSGSAVLNDKLRALLTKQGFKITKTKINGEEVDSFSKTFDVEY